MCPYLGDNLLVFTSQGRVLSADRAQSATCDYSVINLALNLVTLGGNLSVRGRPAGQTENSITWNNKMLVSLRRSGASIIRDASNKGGIKFSINNSSFCLA